jgi:hypothetical protein
VIKSNKCCFDPTFVCFPEKIERQICHGGLSACSWCVTYGVQSTGIYLSQSIQIFWWLHHLWRAWFLTCSSPRWNKLTIDSIGGLSVVRLLSPVSPTFSLHSHTSISTMTEIPSCKFVVPFQISPIWWNRNLVSLLHKESPSLCSKRLLADSGSIIIVILFRSTTTTLIVSRIVQRSKLLHVTRIGGLVVIPGTMVHPISSWCVMVQFCALCTTTN